MKYKKKEKIINETKTKKQQKKLYRRRKNPIDENILWGQLIIPMPVGLPENSITAFKVGELFGLRKLLLQCEGGKSLAAADMLKIAEKNLDKNTLKLFKEKEIDILPSDAFMMGIYVGLIKAGNFCLKEAPMRSFLGGYGIGSNVKIKKYLQEVEDHSLFKKYYPPKQTIKTPTLLQRLGFGPPKKLPYQLTSGK